MVLPKREEARARHSFSCDDQRHFQGDIATIYQHIKGKLLYSSMQKNACSAEIVVPAACGLDPARDINYAMNFPQFNMISHCKIEDRRFAFSS
ncbi:hypothetical protein D3C81_1283010 [compost metagenome]